MPRSDDPVEAFGELAASYCALIEQLEGHDPQDVLDRLWVLLPALISGATQLPEVEPTTGAEAPEISHVEWSERFGTLNAVLGERGSYWTTMEVQADREPAVVNLPLADDLADIWRDLRGGLDSLASTGVVADAVWEWRFTFEIHWGAHAVEALRAVHAALRR